MNGNQYCYYDILIFIELCTLLILYPNFAMLLFIFLVLFNFYPQRGEAEGGADQPRLPTTSLGERHRAHDAVLIPRTSPCHSLMLFVCLQLPCKCFQ